MESWYATEMPNYVAHGHGYATKMPLFSKARVWVCHRIFLVAHDYLVRHKKPFDL
jgi:hypothetical protein